MKQNNIPGFATLDFNGPLNENDCAPNQPHKDTGGLSEFAFGVFYPISKNDSTLASGLKPDALSFVRTDLGCGIDVSKQNGIVKMLWRAKDYRHCTMPANDNDLYT
ncbi:hypothetical protein MJO29_010388 [Puccinia striiformis f. sp. tritici]|uniref:Tet-like 2OG-Fe(II) oxygenase domain-containing protein n=2 Tax=Puccinia striiformis TaxID=27350 RepID=A0A0L0UY25_9BASI|nr:hypothetical protein Pst134EA_019449 [Puccinia striiformis f. sp. tritici]KAI9610667.1 hypothetical protein H4Q26_006814 [Puccinia striiformis f. sp. tritici PST-130]KNE91920.1 hypothetical protein PSTG_14666 [Puccinia striiformis f. sp. tritici PST-78]POW07527.1 hypothetical protein PSHT_09910 [Puccinia striiformis]KAH9449513.1 hypothetical protein Pst134EB_020341 [Puccinia striiformis f. sp. tritici]KAH9459294.1 hypothetical protein Pst134EA_019449 [Puccinia striiformis f. sp. tritici]